MIDFTLGGILPEHAVFFLVVIIISVIAAYAVSVRWLVRIAIGMYIALVLTLLLPERMLFSEYTELGFFVFLAALFVFALCNRLVDSGVSWSHGRLPWLSIIFSFLVITFLVAVLVFFMPTGDISGFVSKDAQGLLVREAWFFVWVAAPAIFLLIFAPRY